MKMKIKRIARDKIEGYTINTTMVGEGQYETAIKLDQGEYIVVEKYANEKRALIGHKCWIDTCKTKPIWVTDIRLSDRNAGARTFRFWVWCCRRSLLTGKSQCHCCNEEKCLYIFDHCVSFRSTNIAKVLWELVIFAYQIITL